MTVLCIAGDPGGSRAVLPVAERLAQRLGVERVLIAAHGTLGRECPERLRPCLTEIPDVATGPFLLARGVACVVFGTSTHDAVPLRVARAAQAVGCRTLHVLDNWSNYRSRLEVDGGPLLVPDLYTAMDQTAYDEAVAAGIPAANVVIAGQPALAETAVCEPARQAEQARALGLPAGRRILLFISEPFRLVFGDDTAAAGHPGFTEDQVLDQLLRALQPHADGVHVAVLPHPKQSADEIARQVEGARGAVSAGVLRVAVGSTALAAAHAVVGMASILLYQAWLAGLPCLSIQPCRRAPFLAYVDRLADMCHARAWQEVPAGVQRLLDNNFRKALTYESHRSLHQRSPDLIAQAVLSMVPGLSTEERL